MIIIIRALYPKRKRKDKEGQKEKKERPKKIKKIKRAMLLSLFPHLCFKVAPCSSCSESHILCFKVAPCFSHSEYHKLSFSYKWEIFIIELGLYIPIMGFLKCHRSSWASKLDAHPLVFFCWAFIALVHPLHGNPYSSCWHQLMGISIAHWLSSSMWDFLLFCLLHTIPIIILFHP